MANAERNPHHPDGLITEELTVGRIVVAHNADGSSVRIEILGEPLTLPRRVNRWIMCRTEPGGDRSYDHEYSLADLGAEPSREGHWNPTNYVTPDE